LLAVVELLHLISYFSNYPSTVSLEGILRASHGLTHKFTGFFLTAERDNVDTRTPAKKLDEDDSVGSFHIVMGAISKFSDKCANLVTHTSMFAKSDVPVRLAGHSFALNVHDNPFHSVLGDLDGAGSRHRLHYVQIDCDRKQRPVVQRRGRFEQDIVRGRSQLW
jgi:Reeler domain